MCGFDLRMENRRHAVDVVGLIAQLAGFIVLISLFFPAVRRVFAGLGLLAAGLSMLVMMGLIGFSVYRLATRKHKRLAENPFVPPGDAPDQNGNGGEPETGNDDESEIGPDLLEPALRRRYPWRRGIADHL